MLKCGKKKFKVVVLFCSDKVVSGFFVSEQIEVKLVLLSLKKD